MKTLILAAIAASCVSFLAVAFAAEADPVKLKYVPADEARATIQKELGEPAAGAVQKVTVRDNSLTLDPKHADFEKVRVMLEKLDRPPEHVHVSAVITREIEATAQAPARREVIARPVVVGGVGKSIKFQVPEGKGAAQVEIIVTPVARSPH
jgi:hypothetical protein